ncbi:ribosomal protein L11 methyltransferase [Thermoanaerobacter mathranii subsp. mathranii str. A3]|uniref:Ribosomal protein L11 methyltransferase n=1 Tax=Thermoanaerobacter mathranii subsp. mathranii (strain DSM 11426 / CCUG 53645 / CIP 108742 / A3) TaxID=583358 RepID=A0ABM5LPJ3_THEM3|nr:50S ribosomal protein L11 methyltransferase [Thermoanaerobacter mathranii]ADH60673.1 ribosomal protein L11 methyltransferase [Thermoanaerobacter mathranii subsp. mathranii str. A3]
MKWIEVQVTTIQEAEEAVTNIMHELGAGGVVIKNPNDVKLLAQSDNWDYIEPSLFEEEGNIKVFAYFPIASDTIDKINILKDRIVELKSFGIDIGNFDLKVSEVDEEDWANNWKQYYKPLKIGKKIVIKPSWEEYVSQGEEIIIELDPGMAFGTGTHETTKMCLELLEEIVMPESIVFDIGCGSGILSIASGKLGAKEVYAADIDEVSVEVARQNVELNNLQNVKVFKSDLLNEFDGKADIIVANIIADVIIKLSTEVPKYLKEEGLFLASGIIKSRKKEVMEKIQPFFEILQIKEEGEWCTILSRKK